MDGVVSNDVVKRRLPPWMLGVAAVDKGRVVDSKNDSDNNREIDGGGGGREDEERVKKRGGRRPKSKVAAQEKRDDFSDGLALEEEKEESSALVVKCGDRKRTKRKLNLDVEDAPKRKMRKGEARRNIQSGDDGTTGRCSENGEDEDLTVEDLMIFAKESVQGDNGAKEVESMKEDEIGDIVKSGKAIDVQENKGLPQGQETKNFSGVTTASVNVTSEGSVCKPRMSGDPVQDMLDLFLGPLLKKAREEEKKVDLSTEEMDFNFEMKRQSTSAATGEEGAAVAATKKKSSLKDRVAMFLD